MSLQNIAPPRSTSRYQNIDALRALAAFLVLWTHTAEVFVSFAGPGNSGGQWVNAIAHQLDFGRIGVITFFAISGFVIPMSLKRDGSGSALRQFAIGRFFRLYPAFWVSILPGALTFYWIWGKPFSATDVLLNLTMIPSAFGAQPAEGLYWTLQIELSFYVLCVLLHRVRWLHSWTRLLQVTFALLAGFLIFRRQPWQLELVHLSIMFFGAACRQYVVSRATPDKKSPLPLAIYAGFWIAVFPAYGLFSIWRGHDAAHPHIGTFVTSYALGMLVFIATLSVPNLKTAVGAWLGKISYSLYLLHPVVLYSLFWWIGHKGPASLQHLHLGLYVLLCAGISVMLAALNYYLVEKPCIRLGNRIKTRLARPAHLAELASRETV
jgi:peptidoglycan/LPS O-acetylase OafA/YrhL